MEKNEPIYFDYNATTPLDPRVFEVMKEWYLGPPTNAGSRTHVYGQRAKAAVELARMQVAEVISVQPEEIYFTSGATESNNIAILGLAAFGERTGRKHIVSTVIEHKAVLEPLTEMKRRGFEVELAPVTPGGYVEAETIRNLLRPDTLLVSVMHSNNETGVIQPIDEIGEFVSHTQAFFHTDAAQSFGKEIAKLREAKCDFISISSHKIFGPQGVGGLVVRRGKAEKRPLEPICFGGSQERGLRPGTIPVALAVGLGEAARLALSEHELRKSVILRNRAIVLDKLNSVEHYINGDQKRCQPHVVNIRIPGIESEAILLLLNDRIAASNGSACTSEAYESSHVLIAMGLGEEESNECLRISWGGDATDLVFPDLEADVKKLRISI